MPSPFPGMDPYLESSTWMNFHTQFSAEVARQLGPKIRPRYLARVTEQYYTEIAVEPDEERAPKLPDVSVLESASGPGRGGAAAVAIVAAPVRVPTVMPVPILHAAVEIRDRRERRLVTAIELLSPTNKRGVGRREYLKKRRRLLRSEAHLVEIDLLRAGRRVPMERALPPAPYYVYVGREESRPMTDVWPIRLDQPLPPVPIPLLPGDPDVMLDLQSALTTVYDISDYGLELDYSKLPGGLLTPEESAWLAHRVHAVGSRR